MLYILFREGVKISSFFLGGGQEGGRRAGTENVLLIAGFGRAAELAVTEQDALTDHMQRLRNDLQAQLCRALPQVTAM
jgi:cysteine desulfurase